MNQRIIEENCIAYAEGFIAPALVDEIEFVEAISDEFGDFAIYECTCDTMEEYYVIYQNSPCALIRKSGIYNNAKRAYELYRLQVENQTIQAEVKDRFSYMEE